MNKDMNLKDSPPNAVTSEEELKNCDDVVTTAPLSRHVNEL